MIIRSLALSFFVSVTSYAAPKNISVTVDNVTYQCSSSNQQPPNNQCDGVIKSTEAKYKACKESYSGSYCFTNTWMKLKSENTKGCWSEAFAGCHEACKESFNGSYCFTNCQ